MEPTTSPPPSIDGCRFRDVTSEHAGDVDAGTIFEYHENDDATIWASYSGGGVRLGFLVGVRAGDELQFRYVHVAATGDTASGRCVSRIEVGPDDLIGMHETWSWESKPGSGTSIVEEIR